MLVFDGSPEELTAGGSLEASFGRLTHVTAPDASRGSLLDTVGDEP
jgi:hypothetical protein